jgi:hypothetical protein
VVRQLRLIGQQHRQNILDLIVLFLKTGRQPSLAEDFAPLLLAMVHYAHRNEQLL